MGAEEAEGETLVDDIDLDSRRAGDSLEGFVDTTQVANAGGAGNSSL